ncbi:hypothetical protein TWF173_001280 [Orbilia oligospora]|nr:hypothetical protein TWF173_001280 [Orbilia oligospora]
MRRVAVVGFWLADFASPCFDAKNAVSWLPCGCYGSDPPSINNIIAINLHPFHPPSFHPAGPIDTPVYDFTEHAIIGFIINSLSSAILLALDVGYITSHRGC